MFPNTICSDFAFFKTNLFIYLPKILSTFQTYNCELRERERERVKRKRASSHVYQYHHQESINNQTHPLTPLKEEARFKCHVHIFSVFFLFSSTFFLYLPLRLLKTNSSSKETKRFSVSKVFSGSVSSAPPMANHFLPPTGIWESGMLLYPPQPTSGSPIATDPFPILTPPPSSSPPPET